MENTTAFFEAEATANTFTIDSERAADWFLGKVASIDAERERITANAARRAAELEADRERLMHLYADQLTAWARTEAETRRRKTVTLLQGSVSFRAVPARMIVSDLDAATLTAADLCPAALVTETVTRFDKAAYIEHARAALDATGEVLPGLDLIPASESVSIKPGAKDAKE